MDILKSKMLNAQLHEGEFSSVQIPSGQCAEFHSGLSELWIFTYSLKAFDVLKRNFKQMSIICSSHHCKWMENSYRQMNIKLWLMWGGKYFRDRTTNAVGSWMELGRGHQGSCASLWAHSANWITINTKSKWRISSASSPVSIWTIVQVQFFLTAQGVQHPSITAMWTYVYMYVCKVSHA